MNFIQKIASAIVVTLLIFGTFTSAVYAQVSLSSLAAKPFGGIIIQAIPETVYCIAHTVIFDFTSSVPIGIAKVPTSLSFAGSKVYERGNLVTPGTFVLGTMVPTPIPCLLPYPVFIINEVGTS